ncbi:hypothetical protein CO046_04060 [Candidatus Peregrinibacteria bacterium CG_4_9_14_0_2_um_filter_53_11]|nr:MAG: hypothetical protein CO046_04060 [Candidatus Peregrinibacteria bacterium CG_4_9_14_0_2_um_filter_53_11]
MQLTATLQIIAACTFLALFPALTWGYVFYRKQKESRSHLIMTFVFGGLAVFPILLYKYLWKSFPQINILNYAKNFEGDLIGISGFALIPLSVIITFMFVGVIEEVMKQSVVHSVDDKQIRHIDDSIMFSIIAALGFSFTENILYFYTIWSNVGHEALLVPFLFRSVFSTFAHILFSSIFGYYYGIAHFAKPLLQEELKANRHIFWSWYHRAINFGTERLFHEQKVLEGFTLAVGLHAVYNVFLEMNWTFIMVPYLVFGYLYVSHLFKVKENHKRLDLVYAEQHNHEPIERGIVRRLKRLFGRA